MFTKMKFFQKYEALLDQLKCIFLLIFLILRILKLFSSNIHVKIIDFIKKQFIVCKQYVRVGLFFK